MANGLVPVARNIGGPPEIWPPDLLDLLVEPKSDAAGFEVALARLPDASDEALLAMKQAAYVHAAATFSLAAQARKFLRWLETFA